MSESHDDKLTLNQLRRLRFPIRNKKGEVVTERRPHFIPPSENRPWVTWEIKFDVDRWEWGMTFAPEKWQDRAWTESDHVIMWLHNYDPNRFLVGINLYTVADLLRFLDAFKVEYYFIPESELEPVNYYGLLKD